MCIVSCLTSSSRHSTLHHAQARAIFSGPVSPQFAVPAASPATPICAGGVIGGHAHRFRDTFAVELHLAGVPLDRVSVLLGHSSIRITERHYAPWTRSRQEQIEADLKAAWRADPVIAADITTRPANKPKIDPTELTRLHFSFHLSQLPSFRTT